MIDKKEKTDILLKKIKGIVSDSITKHKFEKALAAISFIGYYLYQYKTGDTIKVTYIRDGKESTLDMKLIEKD